jgi:hypothetical protein
MPDGSTSHFAAESGDEKTRVIAASDLSLLWIRSARRRMQLCQHLKISALAADMLIVAGRRRNSIQAAKLPGG